MVQQAFCARFLFFSRFFFNASLLAISGDDASLKNGYEQMNGKRRHTITYRKHEQNEFECAVGTRSQIRLNQPCIIVVVASLHFLLFIATFLRIASKSTQTHFVQIHFFSVIFFRSKHKARTRAFV